MKVTKTKIDSYSPKPLGTCAEVTVVLDDCLAIRKVFVVMGEQGLFVAMPNTGQTKLLNNKKHYQDIVYPLNTALKEEITNAVLTAYNDYKA